LVISLTFPVLLAAFPLLAVAPSADSTKVKFSYFFSLFLSPIFFSPFFFQVSMILILGFFFFFFSPAATDSVRWRSSGAIAGFPEGLPGP
jgi:hypothetical protein